VSAETAAKGKKSRVGRADLAACLAALGPSGLARAAAACGYAPIEPEQREKQPAPASPGATAEAPDAPAVETPKTPALTFWQPIRRTMKDPETIVAQPPKWFLEAAPFSTDEALGDPKVKPLPHIPLTPWSRLWPWLRQTLGVKLETDQPDLDRAVDFLARGAPAHRLPRRIRRFWAPICQIVVDRSSRLQPFWDDMRRLIADLAALRGGAGLEILWFERGPEWPCRAWLQPLAPARPYRPPPPQSPVLILSDLGAHAEDAAVKLAWRRFCARLAGRGCPPATLAPCSPARWDAIWAARRRTRLWDWGRLLRPPRTARSGRARGRVGGTERLLALLAPAIRVEPALLRAVRRLLPCAIADVSAECDVWRHPHTRANPLGFAWDAQALPRYQAAFKQETETMQRRVLELIERAHADSIPAVAGEERVAGDALLGRDSGPTPFMARVARALRDGGVAGLREWFQRLARRQWRHRDFWAREDAAVTFVLANIREDDGSEPVFAPEALPPGIALGWAAWVLNGLEAQRTWTLLQQGPEFRLAQGGQTAWEASQPDRGSAVAEFTAGGRFVWVKGGEGVSRVALDDGAAWATPDGEALWTLQSESEAVALRASAKPAWAEAMGRDRAGLFAVLSEGRRLYWFPPGAIAVAGHAAAPLPDGAWMDAGPYDRLRRDGLVRPNWAEALGRDGYGVYADFSVESVVQRMRWLPPGRFLMGSPEDEPERDDDERQHEVLLTRGFWLADTACTQALWQAVMGGNPSAFRGEDRPVESVSWQDAKAFIDKLNGQRPELALRLPTEAEWEYACRAGTATPFSFGETITTDQVNYDGNFPYANGKKGRYREETIPVREPPANDWGLYQMHGNVWEWCGDWYDAYPTAPVVDPTGPESGQARVLRGGSWFYYGRDVRSAVRSMSDPSYRDAFIGFRLARGL